MSSFPAVYDLDANKHLVPKAATSMRRKRLTDAHLSAEWWKARAGLAEMTRGLAWAAAKERADVAEQAAWCRVVHRFAHHPHASETHYQ